MSSPARILVVDDSPQNLRLFKQVLALAGHAVVTATSGIEALELASREPPHLVLLDVLMPGMSGYQVCRALRANAATADVPVVMITGLDPEEERAKAMDAGADDVVTKPFQRADLLARIDALLQRARRAVSPVALVTGDDERLRQQGEVIASMSHELHTPLNAIIGFAELLHQGLVDPSKQQEYLGDILESGRHLLRVIDDLLDVARIDAGTLQLRPEAVSLPGLIAEVCGTLEGAPRPPGVALSVEADLAPTAVALDPARFKQVLRSALEEAFRRSPEAGRVVVRAGAADARSFYLEVQDDGVADGRVSVPALRRRMVELMGGTAGLHRAPGGGGVFRVTLPRQQTLSTGPGPEG